MRGSPRRPESEGRRKPRFPLSTVAAAQFKSGVPTCQLSIKAIPNAPRSEVVGWLGEALKVKVHAPPVEGKANEALCAFLAEALNVPRRAVSVVRGDTSRQKTVRIDGLGLAEVKARFGEPEK